LIFGLHDLIYLFEIAKTCLTFCDAQENDTVSFFDAELDCQNRGAHLLSIHSLEEEIHMQG